MKLMKVKNLSQQWRQGLNAGALAQSPLLNHYATCLPVFNLPSLIDPIKRLREDKSMPDDWIGLVRENVTQGRFELDCV